MRTFNIKQLDEKNEEVTDVLISLGMSRPVAIALSYLKNRNGVTSVELERNAGLRQPEVSIAMGELEKRGWISEREEKKLGKGRPYKIYALKISFNGIIEQLENQQRRAADETQKRIERLKELGR